MGHEVDLNEKNIRTDLAIELTSNEARCEEDDIKITDIVLNREEALKIGKKEGIYVTIEFKDVTDYENREKVKKVFSDELSNILSNKGLGDGLCLIIGLGNSKSTPDCLGPLCAGKVLVTNHLYMYGDLEDGFIRTCAIAPGVTGETGIETGDLIKSAVDILKPDFVIVIDALLASSIERVNRTIQISDSGISPGSGTYNKRKEVSEDVLGVPVISIGVPTVVDAVSIVNDTINYMYRHFAYQMDNYNRPKNKLSFNVNYLKYNSKFDKEDKEKLFGMVGSLSYLEMKSLLYEVLTPTGLNLIVTPKEEDFVIEKLAELISGGIDSVLHSNIN